MRISSVAEAPVGAARRTGFQLGRTYLRLLADDMPAYDQLSAVERGFARMLLYSLWPGGAFGTEDEGLRMLRGEAAARSDMRDVIDLAFDSTRHLTIAAPAELAVPSLRVHARHWRGDPRRAGSGQPAATTVLLPRGRWRR